MPVEIVEVVERSPRGITEPYLCRANDDALYYVKGRYAGRRSLICEWLAGHLARAFSLPIPQFDIVHVPLELSSIKSDLNLARLGAGPAFGSRAVSPCTDFLMAQIDEVPARTQLDVLMFDLWVRNGDRTLSEQGGNANLLWDAARRLVTIDHNLAFEIGLSEHDILDTHVFRSKAHLIAGDMLNRERYTSRFNETLTVLDQASESIPQEWWFDDEQQTHPTNFDLSEAREMLERFRMDEFWKLPA